MKTNLLKLACLTIGVFAVTLTINMTQNRSMESLSKITLANIEALADGGEGGSSSDWPCWSQEKAGSGYWRCGNPCRFVDGVGGKGTSSKCYAN